MDIRMWILFGCSLVFLIGGVYYWFAGKKEWKTVEKMISVDSTILKETKSFNDESYQHLIKAATALDRAKRHLERDEKIDRCFCCIVFRHCKYSFS